MNRLSGILFIPSSFKSSTSLLNVAQAQYVSRFASQKDMIKINSSYTARSYSRRVTTPLEKSKAKLRSGSGGKINFAMLEKETQGAYQKKKSFAEPKFQDKSIVKAQHSQVDSCRSLDECIIIADQI